MFCVLFIHTKNHPSLSLLNNHPLYFILHPYSAVIIFILVLIFRANSNEQKQKFHPRCVYGNDSKYIYIYIYIWPVAVWISTAKIDRYIICFMLWILIWKFYHVTNKVSTRVVFQQIFKSAKGGSQEKENFVYFSPMSEVSSSRREEKRKWVEWHFVSVGGWEGWVEKYIGKCTSQKCSLVCALSGGGRLLGWEFSQHTTIYYYVWCRVALLYFGMALCLCKKEFLQFLYPLPTSSNLFSE